MRSDRTRFLSLAAAAAIGAAVAPLLHGITRQSGQDAHTGTLVELEERFARAARDRGTRAAFLEFLAEDGIVFRPGPVAGRAWWLAADEDPGLLQWYPSAAGMSSSGDLGYTLGPWSYGKRRARPGSFGHYVTVWRREADGTWRAAIDGSITHPRRSRARRLTPAVTMHEPNGVPTVRLDVLALEQRFAGAARVSGYETAAAQAANARSLRIRDGEEPAAFGAGGPGTSVTMSVEGSALSAAADLACAYGTTTDEAGGRAAFLHIWRVIDGEPYLAVDLLTRLPASAFRLPAEADERLAAVDSRSPGVP